MKKVITVLLILACLFALPQSAYAGSSFKLPSITVNLKNEQTVKHRTVLLGGILQIRARSGNTLLRREDLNFRSLNPAVASVDQYGVIWTRAAGEAGILVTMNEGAKCAVLYLTVSDGVYDENVPLHASGEGSFSGGAEWLLIQ